MAFRWKSKIRENIKTFSQKTLDNGSRKRQISVSFFFPVISYHIKYDKILTDKWKNPLLLLIGIEQGRI